MVAGLATGDTGARPHLTRSRSHTTPSSTAVPQQIEEAATAARPQPPPRPPHTRSRSYISPVEPKPRNAETLPIEPTKHSHALRLPGTSHREHKYPLRHRPTQSETKHSKHASMDNLPHLVSKLQKEKAVVEKHNNLSRQGTNNSTSTWQSHVNSLVRIASTDPYRNMNPAGDAAYPAFGASYHRAPDGTSSARQAPTKPPTWIELAIDRAEAKKELERLNPKPAEIEKRQAELASAQDELRDRLTDVGRQSGEIGRRLEYTYYSLLEKLGRLVETIHSFHSLSQQSSQLMANFDSETAKLDGDIQRRIANFKSNFAERDERVADLERRSVDAGVRAQELQTRLQNVSTIVENWERREDESAKKWFRVWGSVGCGSLVIFALVMSVVLYKQWWVYGDSVLPGLGAGTARMDLSLNNNSLAPNLPEEVRALLEDVEAGKRNRPVSSPLASKTGLHNERVERRRDQRLRVLDEL